MTVWRTAVPVGIAVACTVACQAPVEDGGRTDSEIVLRAEVERSVDRVMMSPALRVEEGFHAQVLVPPGQLYDPIALLPRDGAAWVSDHGADEAQRSGRIHTVDASGRVSVVADTGLQTPPTGFDVAPPGFGPFGGQIFLVSQPRAETFGTRQDHAIVRVAPGDNSSGELFCTLPTDASRDGTVPGGETAARFGPGGSPFANRLFVVVAVVQTVYQVTSDGECRPFLVLDDDRWTDPIGLGFSPDGTRMWLAVSRGAATVREALDDASTETSGRRADLDGESGAIIAVDAAGNLDAAPIVDGIEVPWGIGSAPPGFGEHEGTLFFTAGGRSVAAGAQRGRGKLFRVTGDGHAVLVASGFFRPTGLAFVDDAIWVADMKGDYIPGQQLPDGVIVRVVPQ